MRMKSISMGDESSTESKFLTLVQLLKIQYDTARFIHHLVSLKRPVGVECFCPYYQIKPKTFRFERYKLGKYKHIIKC